jgi:hypothetical protein
MATQDNGLNLTGYLIEICFTIIVVFLLTREDRGKRGYDWGYGV